MGQRLPDPPLQEMFPLAECRGGPNWFMQQRALDDYWIWFFHIPQAMICCMIDTRIPHCHVIPIHHKEEPLHQLLDFTPTRNEDLYPRLSVKAMLNNFRSCNLVR